MLKLKVVPLNSVEKLSRNLKLKALLLHRTYMSFDMTMPSLDFESRLKVGCREAGLPCRTEDKTLREFFDLLVGEE